MNSLFAANTKEIDPSRLEKTHYLDYSPVGYPVELWDVLGKMGLYPHDYFRAGTCPTDTFVGLE